MSLREWVSRWIAALYSGEDVHCGEEAETISYEVVS